MIERTTISFFGRTNAGKSSLINAVCAQDVSIVSEIRGTTTDPVKKVMELLPIGPVTIIDTPGLDDDSELGKARIEKAMRVLDSTQIAVLVTKTKKLSDTEKTLLAQFEQRKIPYLIALNKCDEGESTSSCTETALPPEKTLSVSAKTGFNISALKEKLGELYKTAFSSREKTPLVWDLIPHETTVLLVIPIDDAAPKDRLILPQQMILRELLEYGALSLCCTPDTLSSAIKSLQNPPALVITDSQAFKEVNQILPPEIPLTSFSILMSRYKGTLKKSLEGTEKLSSLKNGDKVLISEGCTHHRQCGDIGTVKLPAWIRAFTKTEPLFEFSSGGTFPQDLSGFSLVIHCGGCMLNEKEMQNRSNLADTQKVPFTNYGMVIAKMNGILERSLEPLKLSGKTDI